MSHADLTEGVPMKIINVGRGRFHVIRRYPDGSFDERDWHRKIVMDRRTYSWFNKYDSRFALTKVSPVKCGDRWIGSSILFPHMSVNIPASLDGMSSGSFDDCFGRIGVKRQGRWEDRGRFRVLTRESLVYDFQSGRYFWNGSGPFRFMMLGTGFNVPW